MVREDSTVQTGCRRLDRRHDDYLQEPAQSPLVACDDDGLCGLSQGRSVRAELPAGGVVLGDRSRATSMSSGPGPLPA